MSEGEGKAGIRSGSRARPEPQLGARFTPHKHRDSAHSPHCWTHSRAQTRERMFRGFAISDTLSVYPRSAAPP